MAIVINAKGAVQIGGDIFCKTPGAVQDVLSDLREFDYVKVTQPDHTDKWPSWNAGLDIVRKGKCNSCHSLISTAGIDSHGHTCEACGEATYLLIPEESTVCFFFGFDELAGFGPKLSMKVIRWDYEEGWLYLEPALLESRERGVVHGEQGEQYLNKYSSHWELVEINGTEALKVRFTNDNNHDYRRDIGPSHLESYKNYKIVKVWKGTEHDWPPLRESVTIYEAWRWTPLEQTPTLYEEVIHSVHMVSRVEYYTPDQPIWQPGHYKEMGTFIRHFTTLDADKWDQLSPSFPLDGPGGVEAVKAFCSSKSNKRS